MVTLVNRAKVATSTTGAGTITLGAAESGYQSFADAGVVNSDVVRYTIEDGDAWEIGSGTYSSGTLTRVLDESSTGSLLNLSGNAVVYVSATASDLQRNVQTGSGSSQSIDFSQESVFYSTVSSGVTTYAFSDTSPNTLVTLLADNQYIAAWEVTGASLTGASFDTGSQTSSNLEGLFFKPDGTKMYVSDQGTDNVYQYTLSSAWDITTASYDSVSFSVSGQESTAYGIFFSDDGTKMYVGGTGGDQVFQYTLSTAWDISTASYDSVSLSPSPQGESGGILGFFIGNSGTKAYLSGNFTNNLYEYTLGTAWDLSTATYSGNSINLSVEQNAAGIYFKADGTALIVSGTNTDTVHRFNLSTAWDLSSASLDSSGPTKLFGTESNSGQIYIRADGINAFGVDTSGSRRVIGFSLGEGIALTFPSGMNSPSTVPVPSSGTIGAYSILSSSDATEYYLISAEVNLQ